MQITKLEAYKQGLQESRICNFHMTNPDQTATMETCERCKIIHDPCGCDEDSCCDDCDLVHLSELPPRIRESREGWIRIDARSIDKLAEFEFKKCMKEDGGYCKWEKQDDLVKGTYRNYIFKMMRFAFGDKSLRHLNKQASRKRE